MACGLMVGGIALCGGGSGSGSGGGVVEVFLE